MSLPTHLFNLSADLGLNSPPRGLRRALRRRHGLRRWFGRRCADLGHLLARAGL